jgi:8-oxo-dGTP pyrophosphatase MutT (NUDIX family)
MFDLSINNYIENKIILMNKKKDQCAGFIIYNKTRDKILLVQGKTSKKWGPPKGHQEDFDINSIHTAIREVYQETGILIKSDKKYNSIKAGKVKLYIITLDYDPEININDTNEILKCEWVSIKDLYKNKIDNDLYNSPLRYLIRNKQM